MKTNTRMLVLTALFAALTAVGAFLRFPLGATSFTLQFLFTALAGILLGPRWGALSQAVYVLTGLVGLPVFTMGGGPGYVLQPSFGFLLGLIPAAWTVGCLAPRSISLLRAILACLVGLGVLYLIGLPYLALILNGYLGRNLSLWQTLKAGMLIYLPGDFLKIAITAAVYPPLWKALARQGAAGTAE